jgi:DNA-directed RNA polymerase subunit RPC12/RpoP
MTTPQFTDQDLRCASCGQGFVFSAGEQELYRLRGLISPPEHCPDCARGRVLSKVRRTSLDQITR